MKFFGKGTTTRFIEDQEEKRDKLVTFFIKNIHNKYVFAIIMWNIYNYYTLRYNIYFCGFITCEFLNLFVVIIQFLLTHRFLHFRYLLYGFNVSNLSHI